jgi:DNA-directed RNA polymerase subunit RPC12/RpoP
MEENKRIKCGKCSSEYFPREKKVDNTVTDDYSCPVCGHGHYAEGVTKLNKSILLD